MASQAQLVMRSGPTPGKTFTLNKTEIYIGRDIGNDIVINDAEVSRKHVRLMLQAGQYALEDLGSTNGTFINGQRISGPHILAGGQTVQMGENVVVVFEAATFDPDATALMGAKDNTAREMARLVEPPVPQYVPESPPPQYMPEMPVPQYEAPPPMYAPAPLQPEPAATYTGQAMPPPIYAPAEEEAPPQKSNRTTLIAGCGCLALLACVIIGGALYYIDANNLWCTYMPFIPGC